MNRTELINALGESTGLQKKQASEIIEKFIDMILEALARGDEIRLSGFGTFKVVKIKAKTVTNPQNKEKMEIKAHNRVRFLPSQALKDRVNKK